ncbi:uncharacterized protein LOC100206989 isoform X1 [Hydra vulgaris]|uniref:uncharacterized protein LOC100206989 isoform X1 n=1 Tax=Hydra vulgaris TaxID=6087 RepID=UPI000640F393|nr:uncharacterized protein LOC100206989 [Hydra vulgaris]
MLLVLVVKINMKSFKSNQAKLKILIAALFVLEKVYAISPADYQQMLGKGMDVDWVKTGQGMETFNSTIVKDFSKIGISHVRLRIKDNITTSLLLNIDKVLEACLSSNVIPVIAFQAEFFKLWPTDINLDLVVNWWSQIAERYQSMSLKLSFDIIIEVTDELNNKNDMLNKLYSKVVPIIRNTNPNRIIFISPRVRSEPEKLVDLVIPTPRDYLMVEWHFYASGPSRISKEKIWTIGTDAEKKIITNKIKVALDWQTSNNIYTWVGAWMAGNYNADPKDEIQYTVEEQVRFANFVTCELTKNKIPFAINSDVWFYDRQKYIWNSNLKPVLDEILKTNCNAMQLKKRNVKKTNSEKRGIKKTILNKSNA